MIKNDRDKIVRDRLLVGGVVALSDAELLSIVIGESYRGGSSVEMCEEILEIYSLAELSRNDMRKLRNVGGMGLPSAAVMDATFELGRRLRTAHAVTMSHINNTEDAVRFFRPILGDLPHEEVWAVYLSRSNGVIDKIRVSQGGVSATVVDNRIITKRAIEKLSDAVLIAHNHPSGNTAPSGNDLALTKKLSEALNLFEINLVDHVIISPTGYYSFRENDKL